MAIFDEVYDLKYKLKGIYILKNKINGKRYIGSSQSCLKRRLLEHKRNLLKNKHSNYRLQKDCNKYGINCFDYFLLETDNALNKEYKIMNKYSFHYNLCRIKNNIAYHKGLKRTQSTKDKISNALTGKKLSKEHRLALSKGSIGKNLGKKHFRVTKKILQLDMNNKIIKVWDNGIQDIKRNIKNISSTGISNCLNNRTKTCKGFKWKYEDI